MADVRALIVEGGVVTNAVLASEAFATSQGWRFGPGTEKADNGWTFKDGTFSPPVVAPEPATMDAIMAERDRRIEAGFPFMGKVIQSRAEDRENIAGAKSAAQDAKLLGAEAGDLAWQKKLDPDAGAPAFAWITADDTLLPLDADNVIAMGYAAMLHKQRLIFKAFEIKRRIDAGDAVGPITADALWG